ncbi:hypothetical protein ScPMuIL_005159 [Solemya velum]
MFMIFISSISKDRLSALLQWYKQEGLTPKGKKTGGRKNNTNSLSMDDVKRVLMFLHSYAENNALLPGKVPGFKRDDVKLLPSSHTHVHVYTQYTLSFEGTGNRIVGQSSFRTLWKQLVPYIVTCRPMTDLCRTCQKNNTLIFRSANIQEEDKSRRLFQAEEHIRKVQLERSLYNEMVHQAKVTCHATGIEELHTRAPCSRTMTMHYSFDFAQQVHLPSNPLQPGPINFLVPRKCGILGVCCEGIPRQVNFPVDEAHSISKGSNTVVSYLHFFFERYGLGETDLQLHCDNCSG